MKRALAVLFAAQMSVSAFAEADDLPPIAVETNVMRRVFTTLPLCRRVEGRASVRKPGGDWVVAEEGRFYPFGTAYRAEKGGILVVSFGPDCSATVADGAGFETRAQPIGKSSRSIVPLGGKIELKLAENLPEGAFSVVSSGFTIKNPAGELCLTYEDKGDGDQADIRCVTGSFAVEGRHFAVAVMRAANEIRIRTSRDHLSTVLYGIGGDYVVALDQGLRTREEFDEDGRLHAVTEKSSFGFHLSPSTHVLINRALPAIGERMSVHTMVFDSTGALCSECAFSEGRAEVNTGELVRQKSAASAAALVQRAEAATTETKAVSAAEENPPSEGSDVK